MQRGKSDLMETRNKKQKKWWHDAVTYEVYVPSFCDANGDGIGDLRGVTSKLEYLAQLGIDCIWLTPIMKSPFADCGYDVSDYCSINPVFGTMEDFDELLRKTHEQGMKLILDVVFGHTSDKHPWFQQAASSRQSPKHTYYVWKDPVNGGPPNNWYQGCMCGPAWTYVKEVDQYYYHAFVKDQPQLNWANPEVQEEIYRVIRFWLDKGIDGFRLDAINFLFCEDDFRDNPGEGRAQRRVVNLNQAGIHAIVQKMRSIADEYGDIMMVGEVYPGSTDEGRLYYGNSNNELTQAFNFTFLHTVKEYSTYKDEWGQLQQTADFHREEISLATKLMEMWRYNEQTFRALELWPTVVLGNHDQPRISSVLEGLGEETYRDRLDRIAPYAATGNTKELILCAAILIFSYILTLLDISNTPLMLGMILEDIMEQNFVTAAMSYDRNYSIFFTRPISAAILIITVVLLVSMMRLNKKIEALNAKQMENIAAGHAADDAAAAQQA